MAIVVMTVAVPRPKMLCSVCGEEREILFARKNDICPAASDEKKLLAVMGQDLICSECRNLQMPSAAPLNCTRIAHKPVPVTTRVQ